MRLRWRTTWHCDCDGVSHESVGREAQSNEAMHHAEIMRSVIGVRPQTCPWRVFDHPLVADVLAVRSARKSRALPSTADIPVRVLAGVIEYDRALNAARCDKMDRERRKREAERKKHESR